MTPQSFQTAKQQKKDNDFFFYELNLNQKGDILQKKKKNMVKGDSKLQWHLRRVWETSGKKTGYKMADLVARSQGPHGGSHVESH